MNSSGVFQSMWVCVCIYKLIIHINKPESEQAKQRVYPPTFINQNLITNSHRHTYSVPTVPPIAYVFILLYSNAPLASIIKRSALPDRS